jgi:hypothetical protein
MIKFGFGPNPNPRSIEQMAAAPTDLTVLKDILDKMSKASKHGSPRRTPTAPRSNSPTI